MDSMDSNGKTKCIVCQKQYKHILKHLDYSEKCKDNYPLLQLHKLVKSAGSDQCIICHKRIKHILKHLAKSKSCKSKYPPDKISALKNCFYFHSVQ